MENTITFEVGDVAFCPYYGKKGIIESIKENKEGITWITIQGKTEKDRCITKVMTDNVNNTLPVYLQLICKKADYDAIANKTIFGHPSLPTK